MTEAARYRNLKASKERRRKKSLTMREYNRTVNGCTCHAFDPDKPSGP